jgi:membrane protease subunit HflK
MASNDPGWGGKNNEGPPDLDEIMRNMTRRLNEMFGRKGPSSRPASEQQPSGPMNAGFVLALIVLIWLGTGFYIVDQGKRGVVLRFGRHVETTLPGPRWHMPFPIESVTVVNLEQVRTVEVGYRSHGEGGPGRSRELKESLMLTDDENIIDLQFAVQYNLKSAEDFLFNNRFSPGGAGDIEANAVRGVAETAIREIVGKSRMDFVLYEGREEIAVRAKKLMQDILDRYQAGINIVSVTMQNAQPPEQVQAAFDDAVKAGQDLERQKNEGQAYANDVIPKARGHAARLLEEANGYKQRVINEALGNASRFSQILAEYEKAPQVTRQRLYLEAQEQILANTSKVVVDQKSGGGSLLYLPLDKLISAQPQAAGGPAASGPVQPSAPPVAAESDARTRDAFRSRDRENRP